MREDLSKGGIGLRLRLRHTTLCFVNAHLAAHMKEVRKRNDDFRRIVGQMAWDAGGERVGVADHHAAFFFGDLNYRNMSHKKLRESLYEKTGRPDEWIPIISLKQIEGNPDRRTRKVYI